MYIPNLNFLALFEAEFYEKQTKNIRKNDKKLVFLRLLRDELGLKSRDPEKAPLELLLNIHT